MAANNSNVVCGDERNSSKELEASYLYALLTSKRSVSRRNRASWYLRQLNKIVRCDSIDVIEQDDGTERLVQDLDVHQAHEVPSDDGKDIYLVSMVTNNLASSEPTTNNSPDQNDPRHTHETQRALVTPTTRVVFLSKTIATSIILDLSPSVVSVSPQNDCVFLDSMFDSLKSALHLLVKHHLLTTPQASHQYTLVPRVFVSVIAYTPFVVAKNNQVLMQNRQISSVNIEQVLVELWICLNRLIQELHELVMSTCGINFEYESNKSASNAFVFAPPLNHGIIRHPGSVLDDIYELGLFSASLMPRLSRRSIIIITDGLFASSNNLSTFRLRNIAVSFVSLATESIYPNACFGYTTYNDLMRFVAKSTQGVYISMRDLIETSTNLGKAKEVFLMSNPLYKIFSWNLFSDPDAKMIGPTLALSATPSAANQMVEMKPEYIAKLFCIDQPVEAIEASSGAVDHAVDMELVSSQNYHDWRLFRQLHRNLDADFEQVLSCLLREGYLIKSIQLKHRETSSIVARLVLYWKHNLNIEQELQAPYWNSADPFEFGDSNNLLLKPFLAPSYGDTYCEVFVHGSYNFLHDFYCDKKLRRRSDYRAIAYQQFDQLILGIKQTYDKLQYLSQYYRNSTLSKVPSFLLHGNSLLFEQPHSHNLASTIENVVDKTRQSREFSDYWQEISKLELRNWKNIMHVHTLRLILEHDQLKYKNLHCQNANGRYTHIQCRRAMSAISNFIRGYASFALIEDSLYIRFIHSKEDDLCDIETSATKGFVVIKIKKLLPIVVVYLMFTSGILDSHRAQIVDDIETQLVNCKLRTSSRTSTSQPASNVASTVSVTSQVGLGILRSKTIQSSNESCCVLIRSPLERMLRIYSRSTISEIIAQNITHGLPGSCPMNVMQGNSLAVIRPQRSQKSSLDQSQRQHDASNGLLKLRSTREEQFEEYPTVNNLAIDNRYNPVFGKYLYGIRVVHTINNLPHDLAHQLVNDVLVKISAILMNVRIKQGFHIAFNNSGLLTLVSELTLQDFSNQYHGLHSLCQYLVFPPTIASCCPRPTAITSGGQLHNLTNCTNSRTGLSSVDAVDGVETSSKPSSFCGSLGNSELGFQQPSHETSSPNSNNDNQSEIKVIREYWIEQQYGMTIKSENLHKSLENKRYSSVVDHLFATDLTIFDCLLTYDLLQLLCDKMSPFHNLDLALSLTESRAAPLFSPTSSTGSSSALDNGPLSPPGPPSTILEGTAKDSNSRVPLIEIDYQFSIIKFLDYCQFASLDVVLFRDKGEFFEHHPYEQDSDLLSDMSNQGSRAQSLITDCDSGHKVQANVQKKVPRRISVDLASSEVETATRREHRSSYDSLDTNQTHAQPIVSYSLNHLFLETLHKRLKQIHDKELKLTECDRKLLTNHLRKRKVLLEFGEDEQTVRDPLSQSRLEEKSPSAPLISDAKANANSDPNTDCCVEWRCFMRKGNQENLMILLIPNSLEDVRKWMAQTQADFNDAQTDASSSLFEICPIFVFRCSSTMISTQILSFLNDDEISASNGNELDSDLEQAKSSLEADISLHFGQPCYYFNNLRPLNDELYNEILPLNKFNELSLGISDEKTQELIHFRAFLRKIKNTVLKSRFSSLNEAYLSELFVHKDDISYYINNVDSDIQKKYHVSSHLRSLAEFIKSYEEYQDQLPKETTKECNQLLNSILLQKCGLFINQPLARFDESNPLMKQLHDRKLLFLMRCNYKIDLPILEDNLSNSKFLKSFLKDSTNERTRHQQNSYHHQQQRILMMQRQQLSANSSSHSSIQANIDPTPSIAHQSASSSRHHGPRSAEITCGSMGSTGMVTAGSSPSDSTKSIYGPTNSQRLTHDRVRHPSEYMTPTLSNHIEPILAPSNDIFFLEAFKNTTCSMEDILPDYLEGQAISDVSLRHEAHMAGVLKRKCERKESHHYRRVLRSKGYHSQSHSAINQALKKVDSLGRLEHFCLTPLLFNPSWRSKLAPVRDHTVTTTYNQDTASNVDGQQAELARDQSENHKSLSASNSNFGCSRQDELDERWHNTICNNYIKEYEQYIQTLGFNSVQIRFPASSKLQTSMSSSSGFSSMQTVASKSTSTRKNSLQPSSRTAPNRHKPVSTVSYSRRESTTYSPSTSFIPINTLSPINSNAGPLNTTGTTTSYLIKFLNSGCLVFKVGFCKPYVYSILYSIEGERFNNSSTKNMSVFLDELDSIKVTLHLHSFTYDYHLRSMYSYISRRQISFNPGYHLISFADDFRKYYQKAPNYARNHVLSGDLNITGLNVSGQELYNYIVTHNSNYQLEVLEMTNTAANDLTRTFNSSDNGGASSHSKTQTTTQQLASFLSSQFGGKNNSGSGPHSNDQSDSPPRSHANDYVLIELKREKVRYKDGKEVDVFDCGLLIAHDHERTSTSQNCLCLRYFLILTNQRDLYPKLLHTGDTLIGLGCHRPIRLGIVSQIANSTSAMKNGEMSLRRSVHDMSDSNETTLVEQNLAPYASSTATTTILKPTSDLQDAQSASELLSSSEISGPQSIISTVNSIQSSHSVGASLKHEEYQAPPSVETVSDTEMSMISSVQQSQPDSCSVNSQIVKTEQAEEAIVIEELQSSVKRAHPTTTESGQSSLELNDQTGAKQSHSSGTSLATTNEGRDGMTHSNGTDHEPSGLDAPTVDGSKTNQQQLQEQTICDEEITYLGYFSSDEMDMLKFLQEKTASLKKHLEQIVRQAENHFRRDYLWHKLMQRQTPQDNTIIGSRSSSQEQLPLTVDELLQLLSIVEAVDLSVLDPNLANFTSMHVSWYLKMLTTLNDFKQNQANGSHRIHVVRASKILLLYIDPRCTTAFVLLSITAEKDLVELSMLMKDKQDFCGQSQIGSTKLDQSTAGNESDGTNATAIDLDADCQALISDFINFCATFMWSRLLA